MLRLVQSNKQKLPAHPALGSGRRRFNGYCDVQFVAANRMRTRIPYFHCYVCKSKMDRKTGACKECTKEIITVAIAMREMRMTGRVAEGDFRNCPMAKRYGYPGRMYGTEAAHVSRRWQGLK